MAVLVPAVLPSAFGYQSFVVRSESMEPSISRGDVLVSDPVAAEEAKAGDIVTFEDPYNGGELITHRVREVTFAGDDVLFVTRGDANAGVERWRVPAGTEVPRLSYRIPKVGQTALTAEDPQRRLILIGLGMLAAGGMLLWGRQRARGDA